MRSLNRLLLGAALLCAVGQPRAADATPLNLTLPVVPDIYSGQIDITYDTDTGAFAADGFSLQFVFGAAQTADILNGTFSIDVNVDATGALLPGGAGLLITGDIDTDGDSVADFSGTLLSGDASQFGDSGSSPGVFEFVFDITGGSLVPDFFGAQAGVILGADGNSTFTGSFAVDFSNLSGGVAGTGTGNSDTAPIPEPGTMLLLGAGMAGLAGYGRRQGQKGGQL
jgi:hypothetical protein